MQLEIKTGYRRFLQNRGDAPSEEDDAEEEELKTFMSNCIKVASTVIVSAPSNSEFAQRRLNILATIFSSNPRSEIFSLS